MNDSHKIYAVIAKPAKQHITVDVEIVIELFSSLHCTDSWWCGASFCYFSTRFTHHCYGYQL